MNIACDKRQQGIYRSEAMLPSTPSARSGRWLPKVSKLRAILRLARTVLIVFVASVLISGCAVQAPTAASTPEPHGMTHASNSTPSDAPFDAQFIDGMVVHHQGAVNMARIALAETQRPELQKLARDIITAQEAEITQMQGWRAEWYPGLADTGGMDMDMGPMEMDTDPSVSVDNRFLKAMIAHHEGAIEMAQTAQQKAQHAEIKQLAANIIRTQKAEIELMQQWLTEWEQ